MYFFYNTILSFIIGIKFRKIFNDSACVECLFLGIDGKFDIFLFWPT